MHGFLLFGRGVERVVVDPHRQADTVTDVGRPVGLLADVLELEEGDALAATDVVEDVAHPRRLVVRLQLGVDSGKPIRSS